MKKRTTGIFYLRKINKTRNINFIILEISTIYIFGLFFGSLMCFRYGTGNITDVENLSFYNVLSYYIIMNTSLIIAVFFLGLCLIGTPVILFLLFVKSAGFGMLFANLYITNRLSGIGYSLIYLLPAAFLLFSALIYSVNEGLCCINDLKQSCTKEIYGKIKLSVYFKRHFVPLMLSVVASVTQTICYISAGGIITI